MATVSSPVLRTIRAELIVDRRTVGVSPLIMIFRADYAVRVYASEISLLIGELDRRRGEGSFIVQRVNYSVRVYAGEVDGLIEQLRGIQERLKGGGKDGNA